MAIHLENGSDELSQILRANPRSVVLIDYFGVWCGPCKRIAPMLEDLAAETGIILVKVDVDLPGNKDISDDYQVKALPTLVWITPTQTKRLEGANIQAIKATTYELVSSVSR